MSLIEQEPDSREHHRQRSEFIRELVQRRQGQHSVDRRYRDAAPNVIVQFWHDLREMPRDIEECVASWTRWEANGFKHRLFDQHAARTFIAGSLGTRYERAFGLCYHPAMQADYFRLCYVLVEGGFYVDADDVCVSSDIRWLFEDSRLKLQPLCYDVACDAMVEPSVFLRADACDPSWIFYFNNDPLIAGPGHPLIEHALRQGTSLLEAAGKDALPEIQETTGPGNLTRSIFDLGTALGIRVERDLVVLRDWGSLAVSSWPLSYRDDARNWRLSNRQRFDYTD